MRFCAMDLVIWMRYEGSPIEFHICGVVFYGMYLVYVCWRMVGVG